MYDVDHPGRNEWPEGPSDESVQHVQREPRLRDTCSRILASQTPTALLTADEDPVAMRVVCVNDALTSWLGCDAQDMIGHSALQLCGAHLDGRYLKLLTTRGTGTTLGRRPKMRRDGSTHLIEVSVTPLRGEDGRATHLLVEERTLHTIARV